MIKAAILTVSDSCSRGSRKDISGPVIAEILIGQGHEVSEKKIVADEPDEILKELKGFCEKTDIDMVFTTGGTGLGPRDVTPEVTEGICERMVPGLGELMRAEGLKKTPNAALSRAVAGLCNGTLIINLPGSEKAVRESLEIILGILPHAVDMMRGKGH